MNVTTATTSRPTHGNQTVTLSNNGSTTSSPVDITKSTRGHALRYKPKIVSPSTTDGPDPGGVDKITVIGVSMGVVVVILLIIVLICCRKRKSIKAKLGNSFPVNFKRKHASSDMAPLTSQILDSASLQDHEDEIIRRPLKTAIQNQTRNITPKDQHDAPTFLLDDKNSQIRSFGQYEDNQSNHDIDWDDDFFSDEVYKKTDFTDDVTKQANAELSPGHDSGLDVSGIDEMLMDDGFNFEWTASAK